MKEIALGDATVVAHLADLMDIPAARLIDAGMKELDRMLTVHDVLSFREAWILGGALGFVVVARPDAG